MNNSKVNKKKCEVCGCKLQKMIWAIGLTVITAFAAAASPTLRPTPLPTPNTIQQQCPQGEYIYAEKCTPCPLGKVSSSEKGAFCNDCDAGEYAAANRTVCEACEAGRYAPQAQVMIMYSFPERELRTTFLTVLKAAHHQALRGTPSNFGPNARSRHVITAVMQDGECLSCGAGSSTGGLPVRATSCLPCRAGTFSSGDAAVGNFNCSMCPAGRASASAQTACANCSVGTYAPPPG